MTSPWDTTGPSIFTKDKSKSAVSTQVQARLPVKPRGKEAPIRGRAPIPGLNKNVPVVRERDLERHLVAMVARYPNMLLRKVQWVGRRGAPDRVLLIKHPLMVHGTTVWIELKAPGQKADPHQGREHERMRKLGAVVWLLDSVKAIDDLIASVV